MDDDIGITFRDEALPCQSEGDGTARGCQPRNDFTMAQKSRVDTVGQNETDHQDSRVICGRPDEDGKGEINGKAEYEYKRWRTQP